MNISVFVGPLVGVAIGWLLAQMTRYFDVVWFGAKLNIECNAPGNKDQTPEALFIKFRAENTNDRQVAKNCRAYLVELHQISNGRVVSENLTPDTFQIQWAGFDFEPRDIPGQVKPYVDLVSFSKHTPGWVFLTKPRFYSSMSDLANYRGTYRFTVVVAGDGAKPKKKQIYVDYHGDWHNVPPPYEL